jgi:hypothetical protein
MSIAIASLRTNGVATSVTMKPTMKTPMSE